MLFKVTVTFGDEFDMFVDADEPDEARAMAQSEMEDMQRNGELRVEWTLSEPEEQLS